ncbi:MAG: hypothetical protein Q4G69_11050 [Planctomycetia bacterium]|nr:hypothetical protein [Planctomycetia bacterium]
MILDKIEESLFTCFQVFGKVSEVFATDKDQPLSKGWADAF